MVWHPETLGLLRHKVNAESWHNLEKEYKRQSFSKYSKIPMS